MPACSSCGRENPDGAQFCNACGARLGPATPGETRKTVTVLFADVTGSTALGEQLDPESLRRVMARYFVTAKECIERHGGTVEKFIGDAVMAVFGVPVVHEDDALRALRAASDLRTSLATLNDELGRDYGVALELRTGVNTGEVIVGTEERLATGDAVNAAARLEQAAQPGEILLGAQTLALARGAIEVESVEPLVMKGKAQPFAAFRLLHVAEGAAAFDRRLDAPFVGRSGELAQVRTAYEETVSDRCCRLVTVFGPPGIGKSRLGREVASTLADDAAVLVGRCLPYGEGITYWPLREIFAAAGGEEELAAVLASEAPEEIFWAVRKALERRARERPLALVVEDIHWAEPTFLDLIEHLTDWTRDAPLLLLCMARPELLDERPAWSGRSIMLEPLSEAESDELIEVLLVDPDLDADARSRIREVAEGNPLFVEQLLAMLVEGGDLQHVPPTIHALLAARLDGLPDDEQELLERASVVGADFEWEALGELAPDRRRPPGAALSALVRKELIRPHEAIEDTFRFRHMLIRDAAYERIPKDVRAELHERYADWLDGRGEEFDEIVGYHLEQAHRCLADLGPLDDRARTLAERAAERLAASGRRAHGRGDMPAAASLLDRAAALFPEGDPRRLDLLHLRGRALMESGDWDAADAVLSETVLVGQAAGERAVAAHAAVGLSYLRLHTDTASSHERVRAELEDPIRVFEELGDKVGLARALTLTGLLRCYKGSTAAGIEEIEQAARYAHEAGDRAQEVESLEFAVQYSLHGPTPVTTALNRIEELRPRVQGNRRFDVTLLATRAPFEAMRGHFDEARALIAEAKALAEELGLETILAVRVLHEEGTLELLAGDFAAAERALRPACETLVRIGDIGHFVSMAPTLADALYAQGRGEEAWPSIELAARSTIEEDMDAQIGVRRVRAKLLAQRGQFEEGERLAREAVAIAARTDFLEQHARALTDFAEVLRLAGRSSEAAAALEQAIQLHERKGNVTGMARLRAVLAESV